MAHDGHGAECFAWVRTPRLWDDSGKQGPEAHVITEETSSGRVSNVLGVREEGSLTAEAKTVCVGPGSLVLGQGLRKLFAALPGGGPILEPACPRGDGNRGGRAVTGTPWLATLSWIFPEVQEIAEAFEHPEHAAGTEELSHPRFAPQPVWLITKTASPSWCCRDLGPEKVRQSHARPRGSVPQKQYPASS